MGSSLSKVNCHVHSKEKKKWKQTNKFRYNKPLISNPSDFKHTFHVGSDSSLSKGLNKGPKNSVSNITDADFMEALAHLTQALQAFPSNRITQKPHKLKRKTIYYHGRNTVSDPLIDKYHEPINNRYQPLMSIPSNDNGYLTLKNLSSFDIDHNSQSHDLSDDTQRNSITLDDNNSRYNDFSSCLQSKIDAQILRLARTRSINNRNRATNVNISETRQ
ncbi:hypothetical protein BDB01DRAFT_847135 [Pilobolus umbonatus]|nr:hypothetical protein BDB01DRAFT_847135 [Pilobolus umbonatus]